MSKKIILNPRLVKIYELLRGFGLSEKQASTIASETFKTIPQEYQVPTKAEIEDIEKGRR